MRRRLTDRRIVQLEQLVSVAVPNLALSVPILERLRNDSDAFSQWRRALRESLSLLAMADEVSFDRTEFADSFTGILRDCLADIEKEVKKSPTLSGLRKGASAFVLSGLGTAAVAELSQDPWISVISSGVTSLGVGVTGYFESLKGKRTAKAVWDMFLEFQQLRHIQ